MAVETRSNRNDDSLYYHQHRVCVGDTLERLAVVYDVPVSVKFYFVIGPLEGGLLLDCF